MDTLNKRELREIADIMVKLESEAYLPYKNINGGFAEAIMFDYDDEIVDIELKFGVQSDVVHTENHQIDRIKMELTT